MMDQIMVVIDRSEPLDICAFFADFLHFVPNCESAPLANATSDIYVTLSLPHHIKLIIFLRALRVELV